MFREALVDKILRGEKTQTRRMPSEKPGSPWYIGGCKLKPGEHYAIVPGRGKPQVGRIMVEEVSLVPLVPIGEEDARAEGCRDVCEFLALWDEIHAPTVHLYPKVWRIVFRLYESDR